MKKYESHTGPKVAVETTEKDSRRHHDQTSSSITREKRRKGGVSSVVLQQPNPFDNSDMLADISAKKNNTYSKSSLSRNQSASAEETGPVNGDDPPTKPRRQRRVTRQRSSSLSELRASRQPRPKKKETNANPTTSNSTTFTKKNSTKDASSSVATEWVQESTAALERIAVQKEEMEQQRLDIKKTKKKKKKREVMQDFSLKEFTPIIETPTTELPTQPQHYDVKQKQKKKSKRPKSDEENKNMTNSAEHGQYSQSNATNDTSRNLEQQSKTKKKPKRTKSSDLAGNHHSDESVQAFDMEPSIIMDTFIGNEEPKKSRKKKKKKKHKEKSIREISPDATMKEGDINQLGNIQDETNKNDSAAPQSSAFLDLVTFSKEPRNEKLSKRIPRPTRQRPTRQRSRSLTSIDRGKIRREIPISKHDAISGTVEPTKQSKLKKKTTTSTEAMIGPSSSVNEDDFVFEDDYVDDPIAKLDTAAVERQMKKYQSKIAKLEIQLEESAKTESEQMQQERSQCQAYKQAYREQVLQEQQYTTLNGKKVRDISEAVQSTQELVAFLKRDNARRREENKSYKIKLFDLHQQNIRLEQATESSLAYLRELEDVYWNHETPKNERLKAMLGVCKQQMATLQANVDRAERHCRGEARRKHLYKRATMSLVDTFQERCRDENLVLTITQQSGLLAQEPAAVDDE